GMSAIINLHHDGADAYEEVEWLSLNDATGAVKEANDQAVEDQFLKVWAQLAEYFKDYNEGLLFESMNEIHVGYDALPEGSPYFAIINDLNQSFVDLVRQSGGNNGTRHLVVPGYNTDIGETLKGFVKPTDTVTDHLILSVHFYEPYTYAIEATIPTWG